MPPVPHLALRHASGLSAPVPLSPSPPPFDHLNSLPCLIYPSPLHPHILLLFTSPSLPCCHSFIFSLTTLPLSLFEPIFLITHPLIFPHPLIGRCLEGSLSSPTLFPTPTTISTLSPYHLSPRISLSAQALLDPLGSGDLILLPAKYEIRSLHSFLSRLAERYMKNQEHVFRKEQNKMIRIPTKGLLFIRAASFLQTFKYWRDTLQFLRVINFIFAASLLSRLGPNVC